jgi:hypothetical protein
MNMAMMMLKATGDGAVSLPISIPLRTVRSPSTEESNAKRPNIFENLNNLKLPENNAPEMVGTCVSYQTYRNSEYEDKLAKFADSFDKLSATITSGFQSLTNDFKNSHAMYDDASWYTYEDDHETESQSINDNVIAKHSVEDLLTQKKSGSKNNSPTDIGNESKLEKMKL